LSNFNTEFVGKVRHTFTELESTQVFAQELLAQSRPEEGVLVVAAYQKTGKGLLRNRWESEPGKNLLFSLILYPTFLPLKRSFLLSQALALGVRDWIGEKIGPDVWVKWPNDIYAGDKKVAGMLIQNALLGAAIQSSIAGIGINVNQRDFPPGLPNPASLFTESGRLFGLETSLNELCASLERWYLRLKKGEFDAIQAAYLHHLYGFGQQRAFARPDGAQFEGIIAGVGENGYLLVDTGGQTEAFEVKEIKFI
jgi:BirA family transcriptional regulator, biotin operon repressor / biotin---[acetyl-CoA-carboxylase] ligase